MKIIAETNITLNNSSTVLGELPKAIRRGLLRIGAAAEGYAKDLCPVDTGRLRASITHKADETTAYIGTNVEYGKYVELGTKRHRAQPFLQPAAQDHTDTYNAIMRQELGK